MNKTATSSNCAVALSNCTFTREDTVVANATTETVNEQDTKTFPKCYVGRNGKQNQQKYTNKCVDRQDTTESRVP